MAVGVGQRHTGSSELLSTLVGGILTITLNRPDARNAMSDAMLDALARELAFAEGSRDVRCVALQGSGSAFCAGGDVKAMNSAPLSASAMEERVRYQQAIQRATSGRLAAMAKPSLAVINGPAAGAGLGLALACDLRIMVRSAVLLTAFARVGLSGDFGVGFFLPRLVGDGRARELMFLPEKVTAAEAHEIGLVNWVCEPDMLADRAADIASRLAALPPTALHYMKENFADAQPGDLGAYMDAETVRHLRCTTTADHREGVAAFAEKRAPHFEGN